MHIQILFNRHNKILGTTIILFINIDMTNWHLLLHIRERRVFGFYFVCFLTWMMYGTRENLQIIYKTCLIYLTSFLCNCFTKYINIF